MMPGAFNLQTGTSGPERHFMYEAPKGKFVETSRRICMHCPVLINDIGRVRLSSMLGLKHESLSFVVCSSVNTLFSKIK